MTRLLEAGLPSPKAHRWRWIGAIMLILFTALEAASQTVDVIEARERAQSSRSENGFRNRLSQYDESVASARFLTN